MKTSDMLEICGVTPRLVGSMLKAYIALHEMGVPVFVRVDDRENQFFVSLETACEEVWADYYELGYAWINPRLEKAVAALGCEVDWENPGCLIVYPR